MIVQNGYVFGRDRSDLSNLEFSHTVSVLHYPFEPTLTDGATNNDDDEYRKALSEAKVYLVGTCHDSAQSCQDVIRTMQKVQPDVVMVELCPSRISCLSMDEKEIYGGEFRAANEESKRILNCSLVLGDRPDEITHTRLWNSFTHFEKLCSPIHFLVANYYLRKERQHDVELLNDKNFRECSHKYFADNFSRFFRILVEERDMFMTSTLHDILEKTTHEKYIASKEANVKFEPVVAVAVVGLGHVNGITSKWRTHIDKSTLLTIPHYVPSIADRVTQVGLITFGVAFFGLAKYMAIRRLHRPPRLFSFRALGNIRKGNITT